MKRKSNWFWLAVIGAVLAVCVIAIFARMSHVGDPIKVIPTPNAPVSETPAQSPDVESQTPAVESPTPPVESPTPTPETQSPAVETQPPVTESQPPESQPPVTESQSPVTESRPPEVTETDPPQVVGPIAVVMEGDFIVDVVDLGVITESYTKVYESLYGGSNTVEFAPGDVRVIEATCPDQVCVGQGWLIEDMGSLGDFMPIACMPNAMAIYKVMVDDSAAPEVDGATQ